MNKRILCLFFCLAFSISSYAQEENRKMGLGFQLNQYQDDFGLGLQFTSPEIKKYFALRLRANFMYREYIDEDKTVWTPYHNLALGIKTSEHAITENIRLYSEGGLMTIFPHSKFSKEDLVLGGYGLFGFQFHFDDSFAYFIELGGVGTGAVADKVPGKPIYSNGFLISVGWRMDL